MAAPTLTARQDPTGIKLVNGWKSLYAFARVPAINLWEMDPTPPGWEGGDAIDTTTQHNDILRTKSARGLLEMTDGSFSAAYDPLCYTQIRSLINQEGSITQHFPDGSTLTFYGYLKSFIPGPLVEGEMPTADCTIICTNQDPDTYTEELPVYVDVVGT